MVVFTCQNCNSTLKKNAVEKHFSCRPLLLTCIDCLKDFRGNEYEIHRSCITEAQKYGSSAFVPKPQGVKQEKWMEVAQEVLRRICNIPKYKSICQAIKTSTNIPRNQTRFHNFVKSSCSRFYDPITVDEIFNELKDPKIPKLKSQEIIERNDVCVNKQVEGNDQIELPIEERDSTIPNGSINKTRKKSKHFKEDINNASEFYDDLQDNLSQENFPEGKNENIKTPLLENELKLNKINHSKIKKTEKPEEKKIVSLVDEQNKKYEDQEMKIEENEQQTILENINKREIKEKKYYKKLKKEIISSLSDEQKYRLDKWFKIKGSNHQNVGYENVKQNLEEKRKLTGDRENDTGKRTIERDHEKLSKKLPKRLKKQQSFLNEMSEIENFKPVKDIDRSSKDCTKKRKSNIFNDTEEVDSRFIPKRQCDGIEDVGGERKRLNESVEPEIISDKQGKKFKWRYIIKKVLQGSTKSEMSLKKLRKKVLNEYTAQHRGYASYEKLSGIFNKKVNKTVGVKVLKDRAILIATDN